MYQYMATDVKPKKVKLIGNELKEYKMPDKVSKGLIEFTNTLTEKIKGLTLDEIKKELKGTSFNPS